MNEIQGNLFTGDATSKAALNKKFWAQITSWDGNHFYGWKEVIPYPRASATYPDAPRVGVVATFDSHGNLVTPTTNPIYEINGNRLPIGAIVECSRAYFTQEMDWVYVGQLSSGGFAAFSFPACLTLDCTGVINSVDKSYSWRKLDYVGGGQWQPSADGIFGTCTAFEKNGLPAPIIVQFGERLTHHYVVWLTQVINPVTLLPQFEFSAELEHFNARIIGNANPYAFVEQYPPHTDLANGRLGNCAEMNNVRGANGRSVEMFAFRLPNSAACCSGGVAVPVSYSFSVSGVVQAVGCSTCLSFNGAWTIYYQGPTDPCVWLTGIKSFCGTTADVWALSCDGTYWNLVAGTANAAGVLGNGPVVYSKLVTDWAATGWGNPQTLTIRPNPPETLDCASWPNTVTLVPAGPILNVLTTYWFAWENPPDDDIVPIYPPPTPISSGGKPPILPPPGGPGNGNILIVIGCVLYAWICGAWQIICLCGSGSGGGSGSGPPADSNCVSCCACSSICTLWDAIISMVTPGGSPQDACCSPLNGTWKMTKLENICNWQGTAGNTGGCPGWNLSLVCEGNELTLTITELQSPYQQAEYTGTVQSCAGPNTLRRQSTNPGPGPTTPCNWPDSVIVQPDGGCGQGCGGTGGSGGDVIANCCGCTALPYTWVIDASGWGINNLPGNCLTCDQLNQKWHLTYNPSMLFPCLWTSETWNSPCVGGTAPAWQLTCTSGAWSLHLNDIEGFGAQTTFTLKDGTTFNCLGSNVFQKRTSGGCDNSTPQIPTYITLSPG